MYLCPFAVCRRVPLLPSSLFRLRLPRSGLTLRKGRPELGTRYRLAHPPRCRSHRGEIAPIAQYGESTRTSNRSIGSHPKTGGTQCQELLLQWFCCFQSLGRGPGCLLARLPRVGEDPRPRV